jgi:hypothetical protein
MSDDLAEALLAVAEQISRLGNGTASTDFGAIEGHAMMVEAAGAAIASGLDGVAGALDRIADAIREAK